MLKSFRAEECLFFTIASRLPRRGKEEGFSRGRSIYSATTEYKNLIRLTAKLALAEQGWVKTDKPVYVSLKIIAPMASYTKRDKADMLSGRIQRLPIKSLMISRAISLIIKTIAGIVYEKETQVIAVQAIKEFGDEERVEVFIGTANSMEDVEDDFKKAE